MSDQTKAESMQPIFGDGACDGDGWIIENPDWPKGDLPYRSRCSGCGKCEPERDGIWS